MKKDDNKKSRMGQAMGILHITGYIVAAAAVMVFLSILCYAFVKDENLIGGKRRKQAAAHAVCIRMAAGPADDNIVRNVDSAHFYEGFYGCDRFGI